MNVLSLFDGISCGRMALDKLGIKVDNYFASEIDQNAIKVTQKNYPDTKQLGDVTKVTSLTLPKIDLLIGGSPCQGFSSLGKHLNLDDPRSKLFFEFVRLKNEINPQYFLLENVKMKKEWMDVISEQLGVEPVFINSADFSAQSRQRYYWTNIDIPEWTPRGENLNDILSPGWKSERDKAYCLLTSYDPNTRPRHYIKRCMNQIVFKEFPPDRSQEAMKVWEVENRHLWRGLTVTEAERLQTVPEGYTDAGISDKWRYHALGNGWTVDVIAHILSGMKGV